LDNLFFIVSQLFKPLFRIENIYVVLVLFIFISYLRRWQKILRISIVTSLVLAILLTFTAPIQFLVSNLENRHPQPSAKNLESASGVIVLGGALQEGQIPFERNQTSINENGERLTTALQLLHTFPNLKLLYSTGSGQLLVNGSTEYAAAVKFFNEQKIEGNRIIFENTSRNTFENAKASFEKISPKSNSWILITSATHMNRSVKTFSEAGWSVIPYPVDYQTGTRINWTQISASKGTQLWNRWIHETVASVLYFLRFQLD
jgi:uncharacterized SAM-binding protein YcdF (DUF218 family)